ncbi:hypothetical protein Lal_00025635 [Lupinus albus]|nr:hypothetical protein Lal_00025635 [Lupinus albus]
MGNMEELDKDLLDTFKKVEVNIYLLDAIKKIPRYAKFLTELCTQKRKLKNNERISMGMNVSAMIGSRLSEGLSLKRENPAHLKNSNLTLSLKRGILAQARISQWQQPQSNISRPGETALAQARILQ